MDIINYKGEKALLLDSEDIQAMDAKDYGGRQKAREIIHKLQLIRHEGVRTLLIVTSYPLDKFPMILRTYLTGNSFNVIKCYRRIM